MAIFQSIKQCPKYVLDADIAKCFDRIDQEALLQKLNTFPRLRRLIKGWLRAGVLDGDTLFPTEPEEAHYSFHHLGLTNQINVYTIN